MSKNRFDLTGTLNRIDRFETKTGKTILTLVLDVDKDTKYPQLVPCKIFGRTADMASDWHPGDVLEITGRLGGRDWNGRVFGDIVAESVEVVPEGLGQHREEHARSGKKPGWGEQQDVGAVPNSPAPDEDSIPF
jgi:single-stranded DNA-binding protein